MKRILFTLVTIFILGGCSTIRKLETNTQQQDSTHIEVRTKTIYIQDTVYLEIPAQTAERTTADSTSYLENDYATSNARINLDGTLYHDLKTKPQEKPVNVKLPVENRDSIIYRNIEVEKIIPVERELTWWQKTQIKGFWVELIILIVYIFKKPVLALIRRFI